MTATVYLFVRKSKGLYSAVLYSVGRSLEAPAIHDIEPRSYNSCMYAALLQIENLTVDVVAKESLRTIISLLSVIQIMTINEAKKKISEKIKLF